MEQLLHYVWKHKIFPLKPLETTTGIPVEVIDPGFLNTHAGPDFFNAKLKIGDTLWVGNVEIHINSSDWLKHGHDKDAAYDSVILHVVEHADIEVCRVNGDLVPQMILKCPDYVKLHYDELQKRDKLPACVGILPKLPLLVVHSWLTALRVERLESKNQQLRRRWEFCDKNWENTFFVTLCRNFGFGLNGDTFEAWAGMLPFYALDKHRDDLPQIEAFFFGTAGLLEGSPADDYQAWLKKEYEYLRHKFGLKTSFDGTRWKYLRTRPDNFPHVKIAQLAYLYHHQYNLFSRVMEADSISELFAIFEISSSDYWKLHYMFNRPLQKPAARCMRDRTKELLVINSVVPMLYAYGEHLGQEALLNRAESFLSELKAEDNYITRQWKSLGLKVESAADSQALVQLQKSYCDCKKCLYCRFGYEYMKSPVTGE